MSQIPDHLRYADSHEWIDPSSPEAASVGISDHAQEELTDVVYLELPELGAKVSKGDAIAVIESVKAANDIYAPVSGEIEAVNEVLSEDPDGAGWIFKIRISDPSELDSLMDAEAYRGHVG